MAETRHELAKYRAIFEIYERIKRPKHKKDARDRSAEGPISRKQGFTSKTPSGVSFVKETKKYRTCEDNGFEGCGMF